MELVLEVAKNANMGIDAIDSIKKSVEDDEMCHTALSQRAKLCDIKDRAVAEIEGDKSKAKTPAFQRMMVQSATKMKASIDGSNTNIAQMLIEGYNMGINELIEKSHKANEDGKEAHPLVGELLELYDVSIKELRQYL